MFLLGGDWGKVEKVQKVPARVALLKKKLKEIGLFISLNNPFLWASPAEIYKEFEH